MKSILDDIQSGSFAKRFIADQDNGGAEFLKLREEEAAHSIEATGRGAALALRLEAARRRLHRGLRSTLTAERPLRWRTLDGRFASRPAFGSAALRPHTLSPCWHADEARRTPPALGRGRACFPSRPAG